MKALPDWFFDWITTTEEEDGYVRWHLKENAPDYAREFFHKCAGPWDDEGNVLKQ
ncbi:MAG: hypothetical protein FWG09_04165 [Synergistaceae bacterium]|nr:hypothetical protein [Synergistaceae bacterium]